MSRDEAATRPRPAMPWKAILIAGAATIVASMIANLVVRWLAVSLMDISDDFDPLASPGPVITASVGYGVIALIAFAITYRFARNLRRDWLIVGIAGLALSMFPPLGTSTQDGGDAAAIGTLIVMHIVAALITIPGLLWVVERVQSREEGLGIRD